MCIVRVLKFVMGPLDTNCYLVYDEKSREGLVIDPGGDSDEIKEVVDWIDRLGLAIIAVISTHGHFDHFMGASILVEALSAPFYLNRKDLEIAKLSARWAKYFGYEEPVLPQKIEDLNEGLALKFGACRARAVETPGHTPGSTCVFIENEKILFSGDTLFSGTVGRTDLPGGSEEELLKSLAKLFSSLPWDSVVYPGHGPQTTLERERRANIFVEKALRGALHG